MFRHSLVMMVLSGGAMLSLAPFASAQFSRGGGHLHSHRAFDYSVPERFGARTHLDELAADLKYRANAVCWEMYENYRGNPGFRTTYREAYELLQASKHIYLLVYEEQYIGSGPGHIDHLASDLADIDRLFHHIEEDIARWRPTGYHAHVHSDLHLLMADLEQTLHHLMADYGVTSRIRPAGPRVDAPFPGRGIVVP